VTAVFVRNCAGCLPDSCRNPMVPEEIGLGENPTVAALWRDFARIDSATMVVLNFVKWGSCAPSTGRSNG
jgi:hypothetical protein